MRPLIHRRTPKARGTEPNIEVEKGTGAPGNRCQRIKAHVAALTGYGMEADPEKEIGCFVG